MGRGPIPDSIKSITLVAIDCIRHRGQAIDVVITKCLCIIDIGDHADLVRSVVRILAIRNVLAGCKGGAQIVVFRPRPTHRALRLSFILPANHEAKHPMSNH